jgi:hypothetical protein
MPTFESSEHLYTVLQDVFTEISKQPEHIETFTRSNLVIRMNFTNPEAEVLLDGRQPPLEVFYGPRPGKANLEFEMPADLMHEMWIGRQSTRQAIFSGAIKSKGNVMKAISLLDLFRECERIYPHIAARHSLS